MGTTVTDLYTETKLKISRIEYLKGKYMYNK